MGHPLTVYGKGGQTRGFLDIRDTVSGKRGRNPVYVDVTLGAVVMRVVAWWGGLPQARVTGPPVQAGQGDGLYGRAGVGAASQQQATRHQRQQFERQRFCGGATRRVGEWGT